MRGRRQLLELFRRWDTLEQAIPGAELTSALVELKLSRDDVGEAAGFDERCYRRTIIHARPHYQVLILSWRSDQRSPIHDHSGSTCLVRVIEGAATEIKFVPTPCGRLMPAAAREHPEGSVTVNCDDEIHQMGNFAARGHDLITLHIYTPPPLRWRFYSVAATTLADHELLIQKPARTLRVDLAHLDPAGHASSRQRMGLPWRP
jgi:cysteine dioxygenase